MKKYLSTLLVLINTLAFSQQEASVWYFGVNAGIKFNTNGTITPLTNGQLSTSEGCATIADGSGNLLFYTDGITVWNKNHNVMQNGTGLMGHPSTSQSATIVPLPGSLTLFYVFTLDFEAHANGFRYSIIDISLDVGLGGVTVNKNVLIYTPSNEKLSIVKNTNNTDYWVVTHGWNNNTFYSYLLSSSGLSATPVTSNVGLLTGGITDNSWGCMKIAPDGSKLAICNFTVGFQLFDFSTTTGVVSNPLTISSNSFSYGVEFSTNSKVLYSSTSFSDTDRRVLQYDLTANNIIGSEQTIYNSSTTVPCALQLGPDGKIYIAEGYRPKLGVINNPNIIGSGCNLQMDAIDLAGRTCTLGLPPFVSSFFYSPTIQLNNACVGQNNNFNLNTTQTITSAVWDFGDGTATVSGLSPNHIYTTAGTFPVTVSTTSSLGSGTNNRDIIISNTPTATQPQNIMPCDNDNNGFFTFDLTTQNAVILNGQNPSLFTIKYFANATNYANNIPIANPNNFINSTAYLQQTIIAEVANNANVNCKATTSFTIAVFDVPRPNIPANIPNITSCDNTTVGTDTDGKVVFNLTQRVSAILNGQAGLQFTITYYRDVALSNQITTPTSYQNTNATETIYVKVVNNDNLTCMATTSFNLEVFTLPVTANTSLKQCDDDTDGFSVFNLTEANAKVSANFTNETFSYFETANEAQININPIQNITTYTNQIVSNDIIFVRVSNTNGCFRVITLNLIVSTTQVPVTFTRAFTQCDDAVLGTNTDGITAFNFASVDPEVRNLFPVNQLLTITHYRNLADALAEINAINDISNYRNIGYPNTQNIFTRVDSDLNNDCLLLKSFITLTVERIPIVSPITKNHCDDDQDGKYGFDTTTLQTTLLNGLTNVNVTYFDQNNNPLPSPLPNPFVTQSQILKVVVTNNTAKACSFQTTIQFIVDDLPEAFPIPIALTTLCDDEANPNAQDGKFSFNTTTFQNTILGTQTGMVVNYFDQNNNPLPSPLPNPFVTTSQNVKVEVVNPNNTTCKASYIIAFVVKPVPKINLSGNELVCSDLPSFTKIINAGITDGSATTDYSYIWKRNGNVILGAINYSLSVNQAGIYTVAVSNSLGCSRTRTITVTASDKATIVSINVVDLTTPNSITVYVTGAGNYVYALDDVNGLYQNENNFDNVNAGIHTVYIKDLNGCGVVPKEVAVLGIPDYFTPNADGYNDYWNINGANSSLNANTIIYILDRFGKLIKQITPTSQGWNGTFNNQDLPASDYWYNITLENGKIVKGHFALKR